MPTIFRPIPRPLLSDRECSGSRKVLSRRRFLEQSSLGVALIGSLLGATGCGDKRPPIETELRSTLKDLRESQRAGRTFSGEIRHLDPKARYLTPCTQATGQVQEAILQIDRNFRARTSAEIQREYRTPIEQLWYTVHQVRAFGLDLQKLALIGTMVEFSPDSGAPYIPLQHEGHIGQAAANLCAKVTLDQEIPTRSGVITLRELIAGIAQVYPPRHFEATAEEPSWAIFALATLGPEFIDRPDAGNRDKLALMQYLGTAMKLAGQSRSEGGGCACYYAHFCEGVSRARQAFAASTGGELAAAMNTALTTVELKQAEIFATSAATAIESLSTAMDKLQGSPSREHALEVRGKIGLLGHLLELCAQPWGEAYRTRLNDSLARVAEELSAATIRWFEAGYSHARNFCAETPMVDKTPAATFIEGDLMHAFSGLLWWDGLPKTR